MSSLSDILYALQNGVSAINGVQTKLTTTFLQSGVVISTGSSATIAVNSTLAFTSSQAAGFLSVTTSSGVSYYLALYR